MNHRRIRLVSLTLAAIGTAVLAGCNDEPSADSSSSTTEQTPTTTEVSTTSSPATTAPPETTTTPATVAPTTAATTTPPPTTPPTIAPDDWEAILEELGRRRVALYAAPDLARIGEYCAPGTDCATLLETQLGDAIARGHHIEGQQPFDVIAIEQALVSEEPSPAAARRQRHLRHRSRNAAPRSAGRRRRQRRRRASSSTPPSHGGPSRWRSWESDPSLPWRVVQAEDLPTGGHESGPWSQLVATSLLATRSAHGDWRAPASRPSVGPSPVTGSDRPVCLTSPPRVGSPHADRRWIDIVVRLGAAPVSRADPETQARTGYCTRTVVDGLTTTFECGNVYAVWLENAATGEP